MLYIQFKKILFPLFHIFTNLFESLFINIVNIRRFLKIILFNKTQVRRPRMKNSILKYPLTMTDFSFKYL